MRADNSISRRVVRRLHESTSGLNEQDRDLYRFLVESLTEYAVFAVSVDGRIMSWNSGAEELFGYTNADIVNRRFDVIFTPDDVAAGEPEAELSNARRLGTTHQDRWHVRKDGTHFWGTNTVQPLYDESGTLRAFTKLVRDTTASYVANEELRDREQALRLLVESSRDSAIISIAPDATISTWNAGASRLFGYTPAQAVGLHFTGLFAAANAQIARDVLSHAHLDHVTTFEQWLTRSDGTAFLASGTINELVTVHGGEPRGVVAIIQDTTAAHFAHEALRRRAQHDPLTALANRETFYAHVQRSIALFKRRSATRYAVLFVDLDHFKTINDEVGHIIADNVLVTIARRLESCIRSEDVVGRVGGDEFAILLNGINGSLDAADAAERILNAMQSAIKTDAGDVLATLSVGIALGREEHERPEDVMRDADAAMYVAKTQGRARAVAFDESLGSVVRDTTTLITALRHAVERNELRLQYQPILRLQDRLLVGFEVLVRWKHPRRGLLLPRDFLAHAESSDLIFAIDRWVLDGACRQLKQWRDRGLVTAEFQLSVNVSSREFSRDDFVSDIQNVVTNHSVSAAQLRLEITEGALLERSPQVHATLAAVRALGISIDVDDFGTGYASLEALNEIVVDGLKIDWSFVTGTHARHGWEIIESIVSLAHKLRLIAIAEGIETDDQLNQLRALGCDLGQGRFFASPVGPVAAAALLRDRSSANGFRKAE